MIESPIIPIIADGHGGTGLFGDVLLTCCKKVPVVAAWCPISAILGVADDHPPKACVGAEPPYVQFNSKKVQKLH